MSKNASECELFIVTSKRLYDLIATSRDRVTQAVLMINESNVPMDCEDASDVLSDEELLTLISTLGVGPDLTRLFGGLKDHFDLEKLRYHRIFLMAESDPTGATIHRQLLTWFFLYFRPLLQNGHICSFEEAPPEGISDPDFESRFLLPDSRVPHRRVTGDTLDELLAVSESHRSIPPQHQGL